MLRYNPNPTLARTNARKYQNRSQATIIVKAMNFYTSKAISSKSTQHCLRLLWEGPPYPRNEFTPFDLKSRFRSVVTQWNFMTMQFI